MFKCWESNDLTAGKRNWEKSRRWGDIPADTSSENMKKYMARLDLGMTMDKRWSRDDHRHSMQISCSWIPEGSQDLTHYMPG